MRVHIEDDLYIESDAHCYMLVQSYVADQNCKEMKRTLGYFTTIEHLINKVVDMKIRQSTAKTLSELRKDVEEIREYIKSKIDF